MRGKDPLPRLYDEELRGCRLMFMGSITCTCSKWPAGYFQGFEWSRLYSHF
jgi:hypothetical protein